MWLRTAIYCSSRLVLRRVELDRDGLARSALVLPVVRNTVSSMLRAASVKRMERASAST